MALQKTVFKRKFHSIFKTILFSLVLFTGVFVSAFGLWWYFSHKLLLVTPLAQVSQPQTNTLLTTIQNLCEAKQLTCTHITFENNNTATFFVGPNEQIIISLQKNIPLQIASLQVTMQALTMEEKRFSRIDFRFDKPIVTY